MERRGVGSEGVDDGLCTAVLLVALGWIGIPTPPLTLASTVAFVSSMKINKIGDDGAKAIAKALKINKTLRTLK